MAAAIEAGTLPLERLHSYRKLEAERQAVELRADARARREAQRDQGRLYRRISKDVGRYKRGER